MRVTVNPQSKTLWLQGLLALVAILWPEQIADMCGSTDGSMRTVVLTQCALTALAYVVKIRTPQKDKPQP